ncbi:MAG: type II toxin-antitoxin system RelE/ParE family toxin [Phycisphaera sp.]|nr:type II toxin-antitoxin system RelE/ParE family toxin [Phycisphaera sp.]
MPQPILAPQARRDLVEIWVQIADESFDAADHVLDRINTRLQQLARHPNMGRQRPEFAPDLRSIPIDKWLIFYTPIRDTVEVLRIIHGARDLPDHLG